MKKHVLTGPNRCLSQSHPTITNSYSWIQNQVFLETTKLATKNECRILNTSSCILRNYTHGSLFFYILIANSKRQQKVIWHLLLFCKNFQTISRSVRHPVCENSTAGERHGNSMINAELEGRMVCGWCFSEQQGIRQIGNLSLIT